MAVRPVAASILTRSCDSMIPAAAIRLPHSTAARDNLLASATTIITAVAAHIAAALAGGVMAKADLKNPSVLQWGGTHPRERDVPPATPLQAIPHPSDAAHTPPPSPSSHARLPTGLLPPPLTLMARPASSGVTVTVGRFAAVKSAPLQERGPKR